MRPAHAPTSTPASRQRGVTLIELMVTITITLIVVAALIALFLNISNAQREMVKVNRQIESGRLGSFVLQGELEHAGFWETYTPQFDDVTLSGAPDPSEVPTGAAPDPCMAYDLTTWTAAYRRSLLAIPVQTYDTVPTSCAGVVTNRKAGTDILVVRHADTCAVGDVGCAAEVANSLYFQSSQCGSQASSSFELATSGFTTLLRRDCATPALRRGFISDIYYVRDFAQTQGDGLPTLARSRFGLGADGVTLGQQPAQALIEGIESMRVELGIDTLSKTGAAIDYSKAVDWADSAVRTTPRNRGDGSPDGAFVHCTGAAGCTADQLINVVAVQVHLLARSPETSPGHTDTRTYQLGAATLGPFNDAYKRHVFATTARLNNVAARRDSPAPISP